MNLRTTIQQNQVASFVFITLVLSFAAMLLPASDESALVGLLFVLALCPAVAAFGLVGFTDGRRGLVALLRETFRWRSPLRWYVSALLVAFGLHVVTSILAVVTGRMAAVTLAAPTPYLIAILPLALFEEIGWRGFALRRLLDRHSPFRSNFDRWHSLGADPCRTDRVCPRQYGWTLYSLGRVSGLLRCVPAHLGFHQESA